MFEIDSRWVLQERRGTQGIPAECPDESPKLHAHLNEWKVEQAPAPALHIARCRREQYLSGIVFYVRSISDLFDQLEFVYILLVPIQNQEPPELTQQAIPFSDASARPYICRNIPIRHPRKLQDQQRCLLQPP